jgi:hypothetical protein
MICYTAIFGKYDKLKEPKVITKGWRYICFTNDKNLTSANWEVVYIDNKNLTNVKAARCIKIRFFDYAKSDLSIWCDASTEISCDLNEFVSKYHKDDFTLMQHPSRNCTYYEGRAVIHFGKDTVQNVEKQLSCYLAKGLPTHYGMVQTGVMIRSNTPKVREYCKLWFDEVLKFSHRDQLSFNYIHWKHNLLTPHLISSDILQNEFKISKHG